MRRFENLQPLKVGDWIKDPDVKGTWRYFEVVRINNFTAEIKGYAKTERIYSQDWLLKHRVTDNEVIKFFMERVAKYQEKKKKLTKTINKMKGGKE